ncbi:MAG: tetratricopeptide repeat protein [Methanomicrobiales archaeon]|nr:tetratricopeptide repeat protein [Methanomicrobiales archaeon]
MQHKLHFSRFILLLCIIAGMITSAHSVQALSPGFTYYEDDDGYTQGSLFRTPTWLLSQIDQNIMSTVLDQGPVPTPTEEPLTYDDYLAEGYAALEGGNFRTAYNAFKKAIELEGTSVDAWYGAGIALENQKRYLSAVDAYSNAISYAHNATSRWASYAGKGRILYHLNQYSDAETALISAITQYEMAGISYPDEIEEIYRLIDEISEKTGSSEVLSSSAYTSP